VLNRNNQFIHRLKLHEKFFVNLNVAKTEKHHIDVEIDKLTNSILNTISGDSFQTEINEAIKTDIKQITKKNGWNFNWSAELKTTDRKIYKLSKKTQTSYKGLQVLVIIPAIFTCI
jgi:hypothetical protein